MMRMEEVNVLATIESDTYKCTIAPCGSYDDSVVFTMRGGSETTAILQVDICCIDTTTRTRTDGRHETGLSPLYTTPINTDFGIFLLHLQRVAERAVTLGWRGRFGWYEDLYLPPRGCIQATQFALQTIAPFPICMQTQLNSNVTASNAYERRQKQQQLACLYRHMANLDHVNSLVVSIDHMFWLRTMDGGVIMSCELADEAMSSNYGAIR